MIRLSQGQPIGSASRGRKILEDHCDGFPGRVHFFAGADGGRLATCGVRDNRGNADDDGSQERESR
jgi:hypothetical protein